jgi:predicted small integral membrane protein
MPGYAQVGYVVAVILFFAAIFKILSGMLFDKESNPMTTRREEIRKRKEKKDK